MTNREKLLFVEGIQFAGGSLPLELGVGLNNLALKVIAALDVDVRGISVLTTEVHRELDRGGFRGAEKRRLVSQ